MYNFYFNKSKILTVLLLVILPIVSKAFEGRIFFVRENSLDTVHFCLHVKGDLIRLDEYDSKDQIIRYYIANTQKNSVQIFNPRKKSFCKINPIDIQEITVCNIEILKTENSKSINGYKCYQWRVKDHQCDTEMTFWVTDKEYDFFSDFLRLMNFKIKPSEFYLNIPERNGFIPIHMVERSKLRVYRNSYSLTKIDTTNISSSLFETPNNYKLLDQELTSSNF